MTRESIFYKKEVSERDSTIAEIVGIWRLCAESYRNVVEDYEELLEERRKLGLSLKGVKKQILTDFQKVRVFEFEEEDKVVEYLKDMEVENLKNTLRTIKKALDSYEYKTLTSTISIFRDEIYRETSKRRRKMALNRC